MRFSVRITHEGDCFFAQCLEVDRSGEGATRDDALSNLRHGLEAYYSRVRSVAPPETRTIETIELEVVDEI